jgi:chromosome segregation ATPase
MDVRLALRAQQDRFSTLLVQVATFADELPSDTFAERLAMLETRLEMLYNDTNTANMLAKNLSARLDEIKMKLDEIKSKLDEIETLLVIANSAATKAYQIAKQIESLVNDTELKLINAYQLLKTDAEPNLDSAKQTVMELTTLAEDAQSLAESAEAEASDQQMKALELNNTARMAYQTATEAKMKGQDAVASQNASRQTLHRLMMAVTNQSLDAAAAKAAVMDAKAIVEMAVNESDKALERAMESRPDHGFTELQEKLSSAQQKTTDIKNELSEVNTRFSSLITDIDNSHTEINQLSGTISNAANKAMYLQMRADEAYVKAKEAVANGTSIIAEAEEMLDILTNFSLLINDTRTKAMEALELISDIEMRSNNATAAAEAILDAHEQAHTDAMMAVQLAEEALGVAMEALQRSTEIRDQLLELNMTANQLKADAVDAKMNATKLNTTANRLLEKCVNDTVEANGVIADTTTAIEAQQNCSDKIQVSAVDIESLRNDIANIDRLDPQQILSLQQRINDLRDAITDADLMGVLEELRQQRDNDKAELDSCNDVIKEIELEIYNLKRAVAAGQDGCVGVGPAK